MAHSYIGKKLVLLISENILCWAWKVCTCTSFRYGGLSDLLGSGGSTGSGNISNYEDICNFGLFKHSSAKELCRGLGCSALPLVNASFGQIMGGRAWAGVEVVSPEFSVFHFTCILPLPTSLIGLNKKRTKSAAKHIRGIIWWSLGHNFRIQSSKVLESSCSCSLSIKIQCLRKHNRFSVRSLSFFYILSLSFFYPPPK